MQLLVTRFPEVTTLRTKEQLANAVEEVTEMGPSLSDDFEWALYYSPIEVRDSSPSRFHLEDMVA